MKGTSMAMIHPELRDLIAGFGDLIGCQGLALDSVGRCSLLIGEDLTFDLMFVGESESLVCYVDLGPLERGKGEALYPVFLEANLLWGGTAGATLSISDDTPPHVVLAQTFSWPGAAPQQLHEMVEGFLKTANRWRDVMREVLQEFETDSDMGMSPMALDSIRG